MTAQILRFLFSSHSSPIDVPAFNQASKATSCGYVLLIHFPSNGRYAEVIRPLGGLDVALSFAVRCGVAFSGKLKFYQGKFVCKDWHRLAEYLSAISQMTSYPDADGRGVCHMLGDNEAMAYDDIIARTGFNRQAARQHLGNAVVIPLRAQRSTPASAASQSAAVLGSGN